MLHAAHRLNHWNEGRWRYLTIRGAVPSCEHLESIDASAVQMNNWLERRSELCRADRGDGGSVHGIASLIVHVGSRSYKNRAERGCEMRSLRGSVVS